MAFLVFLLLSLMNSPASLMPSPNVIDISQEIKDISEINKGLGLFEGDIKQGGSGVQRSAILGETYRWDKYVPYVLASSLSLNDKGVIIRAFEQLRLKSCIDFIPRTTEVNYISVEDLSGCWSYVGKQSSGKQQLSIGFDCAIVGIVEHEFLHALGFYHEQSRYDRDDYVTIMDQNIATGYASNFNKMSESETTTQGTPYDYISVMHYGKFFFSNGNGPTIITKVPEFQDLIGQRYDMSYWDAYELNRLYNCNASISFLDHCSFDNESICQMTTCMSASSNNQGWKRVSNVSGGPLTDHTYLGRQSAGSTSPSGNSTSLGPSFFMHFSTKDVQTGDSGRLESRVITPQRNCHVQCLEFFYYHTGNDTDQLNIWIREFQNASDITGTLKLVDHITGPATGFWKLHNVPLNMDKPFLVEFEARKGDGVSTGGFSVDDINLSETECPDIWQIRNFDELWNRSAPGTFIYSPLHYSPKGYRYQAMLQKYVGYLGIDVRLVSGIYDDQLQWPCFQRQVTYMLLDQNPNIQQRMSYQKSFTTSSADIFDIWDNPRLYGTKVVTGDNETVYVNAGLGYSFFPIKQLSDREFVKGGDLILLFSMQDISALQQNNSLPCSSVRVKNFTVSPYQGAEKGSCKAQATATTNSTAPTTATATTSTTATATTSTTATATTTTTATATTTTTTATTTTTPTIPTTTTTATPTITTTTAATTTTPTIPTTTTTATPTITTTTATTTTTPTIPTTTTTATPTITTTTAATTTTPAIPSTTTTTAATTTNTTTPTTTNTTTPTTTTTTTPTTTTPTIPTTTTPTIPTTTTTASTTITTATTTTNTTTRTTTTTTTPTTTTTTTPTTTTSECLNITCSSGNIIHSSVTLLLTLLVLLVLNS